MSQEELAYRTGLSRVTISRAENNSAAISGTIGPLAEFFNLDRKDLITAPLPKLNKPNYVLIMHIAADHKKYDATMLQPKLQEALEADIYSIQLIKIAEGQSVVATFRITPWTAYQLLQWFDTGRLTHLRIRMIEIPFPLVPAFNARPDDVGIMWDVGLTIDFEAYNNDYLWALRHVFPHLHVRKLRNWFTFRRIVKRPTPATVQ